MTVKVDERVARAAMLLRSPECAPLMLYLGAVRAETLENLAVHGDARVIHLLQGKAQFLAEFLELVETSPVLAQKLKR